MNNANEDRLPEYITDKWGKIVELLAEVTGFPVAFITRIKSDRLVILNYCDKRDNLAEGKKMDHETINLANLVKNKGGYLANFATDRVINKILCDKYNFRSLLSYSLKDSRNKTFGRICLADSKENNLSDINKKIILEFKGFIENHLEVYDLHNKLAENRHELLETKQELQFVFESVAEGIIVTDIKNQIQLMNKAAEELTGWGKDAIGRDASEVFEIINEETGESVKNLVEKVLNNGKIQELAKDTILISRDGTRRGITNSVTAVSSEDGAVIGVVMVFSDITENKQVKQELKRSKKELENTIHELHNVVEETVDALGSAVGARDAYTSRHQERVARLSFEIARELDLPGDCCKGIYLAALIHDIGKIKIPIDILSKPSILSELEFELIKTHSETGYMILNKIEFPWPIADIVMQHHERLDGSGYPEGRTGDDILLQSRIIAVADVVEAMTSHRPYRPALGLDKALNEVEKNRGLLYDKEVVDSCLDVFRKNNDQVITWMGGNN